MSILSMPLNCKIYCNLFSNPAAFLAEDFRVLFLKFLVERAFGVSPPCMVRRAWVAGTCWGSSRQHVFSGCS